MLGLWVSLFVALFVVGHTTAEPTGRWFERILIITFENMGDNEVGSNAKWTALFSRGMSLTNFHAITHPSQPNYWCQVAGDYFRNTNSAVDLDARNLADLFEEHGVSWKAYQENYPGNCFDGDEVNGLYRRKHNPFISFNSVRLNRTRCDKIVNASQFDLDLESGALPQFSYYTPNMNNDGHDTSTEFSGSYATTFLDKYHNKIPNGTLIVLTWDESNYLIGTNAISTILIGSMIQEASTDDTYFDHYSLLKTVEENWALGNLGRNDAASDVNVFNFGQDQQLSDGLNRLWKIFGPHTLLISLAIVVGLMLIVGLAVLAFSANAREKVRAAWEERTCSHSAQSESDDGEELLS